MRAGALKQRVGGRGHFAVWLGLAVAGTTLSAGAPMEIVIYGQGTVLLGLGLAALTELRDTVRLNHLPAFSADVTNGEVHVEMRRLAGSLELAGDATGAAMKSFTAARDTLRLATAQLWSPAAWRQLAAADLALGDSVSAADAWAHVAVDPRTAAGTRDSLGRVAERLIGTGAWRERRAASLKRLGAHLDARAIRRIIGELDIATLNGERRPMRAMARGGGLVVVFWSPQCGPAVEALPEIEALRKRLGQQNVSLILVAVQSSVTPELTAVLSKERV